MNAFCVKSQCCSNSTEFKNLENNVLSHHVEFYLQFVGSAVYNQLLLLYPICSAQRHLNR